MLFKSLGTLALIGFVSAGAAQISNRETQWNQDLTLFASEFSAHQMDFAKLYARAAFDGDIASLKTDIPKLTDVEITLRLMHLVASANVGHTNVYLPIVKLGFLPIPFSTAWYSDGLAVVGATPEYTDHLGARILKIGWMTPDQVLASVAPYISHENDTWLRQQSPGFMQMWPVLQHIGAIDAGEPVKLTLVKPGGEPYVIEIPKNAPLRKHVSMYDVLPIPMSLHREKMDRKYWYEYLPDSKTLYLEYHECSNDPNLPFDKFAASVFQEADSKTVNRFVVDLRFNGGGDSRIIGPLISGLKSRAKLRSHLYVLIGPGTFSSAQLNAIDLREKSGAELVGQSTGEKPNSYGEVRTFTLPNSGLRIQYSTKFLRLASGDAPSLEPAVTIPYTLDDALAGRDPALSYVLSQ